jgi:CheY-like chemotaxis protein/HPt (histidine-containing phosphotransfer) domain-containing protein
VQHENLRGRILVAEDQVVNQMVVQKFLASFGLECVIAEEGGAAVQKAKEEHFDLILMDCRMIPVDGYEATRQIRAFNPAIPIVALTAEGISGERALCFEAGMNKVLTKPVEIDRLYRTLKQYLARPEFNEAQLDKLAGYESGGKPLIEALKEDFYVSALELCRSLRAAWKDGDDEKMKHYAHALRSPSLTLGMAGLAALCEEIEDSTVPVEANKIDQLDEMYNRACAWLGRQGLSSKAS